MGSANQQMQSRPKSPETPFDPAAYWEERLRKNPGITGVGYTSLGKYYNQWQYKVREKVFQRILGSLQIDQAAAKVLDIGSGTGFYLQLWKETGVKFLVGSDLTTVAISRLREKFPSVELEEFDIGGAPREHWAHCFDVISAFDVFFHIVDDVKYQRAIANVYSMLRPGGLFLFSDLLLHGPTQRSLHMVSRSLEEVDDLLRATGFEIIRRVPMFVLMNHPIDTRSKVHAFLWRLFVYVTRKSAILGYLSGAFLYPLELFLTRFVRESPTTEILVCRRTATKVG